MKIKLRSNCLMGATIVTCLLMSPAKPNAQDQVDDDNPILAPLRARATGAAYEMVPTEGLLANELDSRRIRDDQPFEVTLIHKVQLSDGQMLPGKTRLLGKVVTNEIGANGVATLALRISVARLKNGRSVSLRATVTGFAPPVIDFGWSDYTAEDTPPAPWDGKTLEISQMGILPGLDLHSRIAGKNSGVFTSTRKETVRLLRNSQIYMVIAPTQAAESVGPPTPPVDYSRSTKNIR